MPRFDGTGPAGMGPMTGRGMGPCNPYWGGSGYGYGRGMGRGFGRGMGWGRMATGPMYGPTMMPNYQARITKDEEKQMLTDDLEVLKQEVSDIEKRLSQLDQEK